MINIAYLSLDFSLHVFLHRPLVALQDSQSAYHTFEPSDLYWGMARGFFQLLMQLCSGFLDGFKKSGFLMKPVLPMLPGCGNFNRKYAHRRLPQQFLLFDIFHPTHALAASFDSVRSQNRPFSGSPPNWKWPMLLQARKAKYLRRTWSS